MSRPARSSLGPATTWLGVAGLLLGILFYTNSIVSPRYEAPITDFGRDIAGARTAEHGIDPYQTLGDLSDTVPGLTVATVSRQQWVAHSPVSIAAARLMWLLAGEDAEPVATMTVVIATILLICVVLLYGYRSGHPMPWLILAAAILLSVGVESDLRWLQGGSILGVLLFAVLWAHQSGRHTIALLLLGVLVAWRPWCAPLAFFLPGSERPLGDGVTVGTTAGLSTIAALPLVGGFPALGSWLTVALPENGADYLNDRWNLALTESLWPLGAVIAIVAILWLGLGSRHRPATSLRPRVGALAVLGLLPLVWSHYWLGCQRLCCLHPGLVRSNLCSSLWPSWPCQ